MSSGMKAFLKITFESVIKGIIIALMIIFAEHMGWL